MIRSTFRSLALACAAASVPMLSSAQTPCQKQYGNDPSIQCLRVALDPALLLNSHARDNSKFSYYADALKDEKARVPNAWGWKDAGLPEHKEFFGKLIQVYLALRDQILPGKEVRDANGRLVFNRPTFESLGMNAETFIAAGMTPKLYLADAQPAGVNPGGGRTDHYKPVRVDISYHANNLGTAPPLDGGSCPGAEARARITGKIGARITEETFEHQGAGDVTATPHLSRCRAPVINFQVDKVELRVLTPGRILQATLSVHISQEGVHRPGDCPVGTRGTIVATFDETATAANSLPNHSLQFGPWESPCTAHTQTITNNISSIAADGSSSTWVRVWIACKGEGTGFAPKFCT